MRKCYKYNMNNVGAGLVPAQLQRNTQKGITLVALVITIIVLLILAVVSINLLINNGILGKARGATFKSEIKAYEEELKLSIVNDQIDKLGPRTEKFNVRRKNYNDSQSFTQAMREKIPSFKEKYAEKLEIQEDELVYIGMDDEERNWFKEAKMNGSPVLKINYVDMEGNKLAEPYIATIFDSYYYVKSPEIEGYMPSKDSAEGEITEDIEIDVEYYAICNDLAFEGLDATGSVTEVEADIVSYQVAGIGNCNNSHVAIPEIYNGKKVTKIKKEAFVANKSIISIIISKNIDNIEKYCFKDSNLQEAIVRGKVIGYDMFWNCSNLKQIEIGKSVESIENYAFENCSSLEKVILKTENFSLKGYNAFTNCDSLNKIEVDSENANYKDINGVVYTKDEKKLVLYPSGKEGNVEILDTAEELGYAAFANNKKITSVNISSNIKKIGNYQFYNCSNLQNAKIEGNEIGYDMFWNCSNLKQIEIGKNVESIENYAFENCSSLEKVILKTENFSLKGHKAFANCDSLNKIEVDSENANYKDINGVVYTKDEKKLVLYPSGKEGNVEILDTAEELGYAAFASNKKITSVNISSNIKKIGNYQFYNCSNLQNAKIEGNEIGYDMFWNCSNLKQIEIGKNVESIENYAFENCTNVSNITYMGTVEEWNNITKASKWARGSVIKTITCTDGTIEL